MATIFCRALWISLGLIAGAAPSLAQQQVPVPPDQPARVYDYVFPVEFEGAKRLSVRGYDDPGLGYSVGYQRGAVTVTIYIYDAGQKAIPDNPDDAVVMAELRSSTIEAMQFRKNAEMKKGFALADDRKLRRLVCVLITDYSNMEGTVCVGGAKNKFIKFRTSAPAKPDALAESAAFIRTWMKFFWPPS
jgi:hypothetical protein